MNFRWFRFPCWDSSFGCRLYSASSSDEAPLPSPHPGGSTTLSSKTQASRPLPPLELVVGRNRCAHFGIIPRFKINRVVRSRPVSASIVRESTSTESTCRAKGFGYRRKKAKRGVAVDSGLRALARSAGSDEDYSLLVGLLIELDH